MNYPLGRRAFMNTFDNVLMFKFKRCNRTHLLSTHDALML